MNMGTTTKADGVSTRNKGSIGEHEDESERGGDQRGSISQGTDREDVRTVHVDHRPTQVSSVAAVVAGIVAAVTSAPFVLLALPLGIGGVAMIAGGLFYRPNRTWISVGAVCLYLSPVIAGGFGVPSELLLVSVIASLLAWNFGQYAMDLGEQIGRHSPTQRNEVIHISVVMIVAVLAGTVGYAVYTAAGRGQPVAALTMLLFGGILLTWAIRT